MNILNLAFLESEKIDYYTIAESRRVAALIAVLLPIATIIILIISVIKAIFDFSSFMSHSILLMTAVPGISAVIYWCKRYAVPLMVALRIAEPISSRRGVLNFFGSEYLINKYMFIRFDRSMISLYNGDEEIKTLPAYFVTIRGYR